MCTLTSILRILERSSNQQVSEPSSIHAWPKMDRWCWCQALHPAAQVRMGLPITESSHRWHWVKPSCIFITVSCRLDECVSWSPCMVEITDYSLTTWGDGESALQYCLEHQWFQKALPLSLAVIIRSVALNGIEKILKSSRLHRRSFPGRIFMGITFMIIIGIIFSVTWF